MDWRKAQPFRPACLIYSCKSRVPRLKSNLPSPQLSQILYHTISQHISSLLSIGGESAIDSSCKQAKSRLAIPLGHLGNWGHGSQRKGWKRRREDQKECCLAPFPHCMVLRCICLCCWLLKNVSWPLCPIPGGIISPA